MSMPTIAMIWAQSIDRDPIIGIDGQLPWHVSEDLRHFQQLTLGHTVVMGRKTWQSLPSKPLKGRHNVVVTRSDETYDGAEVIHNLIDDLEAYANGDSKLIIIGGQELFTQTIAYATELYVTEVHIELHGGKGEYTYAPRIDSSWILREAAPWRESRHSGLYYRHLQYDRPSSLVMST